jgi:ATP-dependent helicase/nuclease subunit A
LVDEAQDTSPLQWDILRMISGDFFASSKTSQMPNSIFVVGDTKQSIYGFQGADPSAFSHSRAEIAAQIKNNMRDIQEIPLAQSFRSVAPILNTVDSFFSDKDVRDLTGFVNNSHKCFRLHDKGYVHINKLYSKQDDTDTSLTGYINDISDEIQRVLNTNKYQPSDIMVLVQRRSLLAAPLVAELKRRNIAVAGSDRISLPDFPLVRDLLNLVRWCLDDTDDFSLCCVLKSPMFYLKEVDIYKLCAIRNDTNRTIKQSDSDAKTITVYDVLEQSLPDVYARLTTIKDNAQNLSPYSFFCDVLNTDNTRQRFVSALGAQVIDPLEEFITICLSYERTQSGTMRDFLKWFITGGSEVVRDMNTASGVRIVTVHGSKGLEAPVVFLVDTVRMPKSEKILSLETGRAPVWLWGVGAADSAIYNTLSEQCADKKLAEYYRLLYVAMTRARDILYIYGYSATSSAPEKSWHTQLWRVFSTSDQSDFIRITNEDIA